MRSARESEAIPGIRLPEDRRSGADEDGESPPVVDLRRRFELPAIKPSRRARWRLLTLATLAMDLVAIGAALAMATAIRYGGSFETSPHGSGLVVWLLLWTTGLAAVGLYDHPLAQDPAEELRLMVHGVTLGAAIAIIASFWVDFQLARGWVVLSWALALGTLAIARRALRKTVYALRKKGYLLRRALIAGTDSSATALSDAVARAPWEGLDIVGFVGDRADPGPNRPPVLGSTEELRDLTVSLGVSEVLVAPTMAGNGHLAGILSALDGVPVELLVAPGLEGFLTSRLKVQSLGDHAVVAIERVELRPGARAMKRFLDLVLGSLLLVVGAPIVAVCAVAVRLDSPGPVFFRQRRVGRRGREFTIWKLRTMIADAEERLDLVTQLNEAGEVLFKIRQDPRLTRVGKFLRRTSLDELPQVINVLAGHMSLVGPRPPLPAEVARYDDRLGRRLLVKPGVTGLWQVKGRSALSFEDYVRYDLLYAQNWSIALDLYILAKTIPTVLFQRGAF